MQPQHDAAGNLTYDGNYRYTYNAWNQLVTVEHAYADPDSDPGNEPETGSLVQVSDYDGLGRRIVKQVKNSGHLNMTYHYYYSGQRLIETRNGSDWAVKQYIWAPTSGGGYIDELVMIAVNENLIGEGYGYDTTGCKIKYWVMQGVNYNVMGVTDDAGGLVERYEYSPYGKRQVYFSAGLNDPKATAPTSMSRRLDYYYGIPGPAQDGHPYGLNPFGHQGLYHDAATGLVHNRARMLHPALGRFMQRDPLGYVDGMSLYQYLQASPLQNTDSSGLVSGGDVIGGDISNEVSAGAGWYWGLGGSADITVNRDIEDCCKDGKKISDGKTTYDVNGEVHAGIGFGGHVNLLGVGLDLEYQGPGAKIGINGNGTINECKKTGDRCLKFCGYGGIGFRNKVNVGASKLISGTAEATIAGELRACVNVGPGCEQEGLAIGFCGDAAVKGNFTVLWTKFEGWLANKSGCVALYGTNEMLE